MVWIKSSSFYPLFKLSRWQLKIYQYWQHFHQYCFHNISAISLHFYCMITLLLNISCQSYWSFNVWIRFYSSCYFDNSKTYVDVGVRVLFLSIILMNFPRVRRNGKGFPESIKWSIKEKKLLWKYREKKYYFIPIEVGNFTLSVPLIISPRPMWMFSPHSPPSVGPFSPRVHLKSISIFLQALRDK